MYHLWIIYNNLVSSRTNTWNCFRRLQEFHDTTAKIRPRLGGTSTNNLAFLRQRVERQRSVINPQQVRCDSLEDINSELKSDVENTKNSVERLDNQISSLHQDVATLSMEVRKCTKEKIRIKIPQLTYKMCLDIYYLFSP